MDNPQKLTRETNVCPDRTTIAKETLQILEQGWYTAPSGRQVDIREAVAAAANQTRLHGAGDPTLKELPDNSFGATIITLTNETTGNAVARLAKSGENHIGCLNFASAKTPGGGFQRGARAQEEDLALASALYPCLLTAPEFYERNRAQPSAMYLDLAISSPQVPFFRDTYMQPMETPVRATVITCPAPNAAAITLNEQDRIKDIPQTLEIRMEMIMAIARQLKIHTLVLGAWGCGIFGNDPEIVAKLFRKVLTNHVGAFAQVLFAAYDNSPEQKTFRAFQTVLGPT